MWVKQTHQLLGLGYKAKEVASKVQGQALTLAELNDFYPEEGMILANMTSVGMEPRIEETPVSKVCLLKFNLFSNSEVSCAETEFETRSLFFHDRKL
ncbi:hypothetical protein V6N13_082685 [Hibiscus sabdariffa]|uniref:Uncharacterized protein n=2 Tax=Hibiscus sabdariffa TaxID=183260 RepID=A0ABR2Q447_9ROSI